MKTIIAAAARHPVFPNLLMAVILVAGLLGYMSLRREATPDITTDIVNIIVPYPGASAREVEEGIVIKVENAIDDLQGIKSVTSFAREGTADIQVKLLEKIENKQEVITKIKDRVDQITTFPENAEQPQVTRAEKSSVAVMLILAGDVSERVMREMAYDIRDELMDLGIAEIELGGVRDYEIVVEVSRDALNAYNLTMAEVADIIRKGSVSLPSGSVKTAHREYKLEVTGRKYDAESYGNLVIQVAGQGHLVRLADIAQVRDGFTEEETIGRFNGKRAVILNVMRTGDEDTINISNMVHSYLETKGSRLPHGVTLNVFGDFADEVVSQIDILITNAWQGLLLLMLFLWFFMNLKLALWISVGIPIAFAFTGFVLFSQGLTLNSISLFSLILVLGIVVDDAIVIGENIHAHQQRGMPPLQAAIEGTAEMSMPVIGAVTTTILAFMPLFFVTGVMGKFVFVMPVVVIATLVGSVIEGLLILPSHLGHGHPEKEEHSAGWGQNIRKKIDAGIEYTIDRIYRPAYYVSLKYKYATVAAAVFLALMTLGLMAGGKVPFIIFPDTDNLFLQAEVEFADGTPIEVTKEAISRLEQGAAAINPKYGEHGNQEGSLTRDVFAEAGGATGAPHKGKVRLSLVPPENRDLHSKEILNLWRKETPRISGTTRLKFTSMGDFSAVVKDVEVLLSGPDLDSLEKAAFDVRQALETYPGVFDIESDFKIGKPVLNVDLKPQGIAAGLTLDALANQLKQGFYGTEVLKVQRGRDEVEVNVRYPPSERQSLSDLSDVKLITPTGDRPPLSAVANVDLRRGVGEIKREDGSRRVSVYAAVDKNITTPMEVLNEFRKEKLERIKGSYPGVRIGFGGSDAETQDSLTSLAVGFLFAAMGIYAVLALIFRSYAQPLIIMSTIPLGLIGAVLGHFVMGYAMSMLSLFGVVALAGVVVNDSLVLIERVNEGQQEGLNVLDSLKEAGPRRFKAIIMTSATTVAGLLPLLSESSLQAQFLKPMALSLAAGLMFATLLTLFVVPCIYYILNDIRRTLRWLKTGTWPVPETVEPAYQATRGGH